MKEINGTHGTVWVDGELWMEVESFEAKLTPQYEDINNANSMATHKKLIGWTGEGTMNIRKIYSRMQNKVSQDLKRGITTRSSIVSKLADPDSNGTERVVLYDVTFNEIMLAKFEQKTVVKEDIPFAFSDFDMPDTIAN
jgi:hypothetical protein